MTTRASTSRILSNTQPPPRKEDIINAMVERARVKHSEECARLSVLRKAAEDKFNAAVMEELRKHPDNFSVRVCDYRLPKVEYTMQVIPFAIARLKDAIGEVPSLYSFDAAEFQRKVRADTDTDTGGKRMKALLDDPNVVKALDSALDQITKTTP